MYSYKYPLFFSRLFETPVRDFGHCTEEESIDQNLELIMTTSPGEHKFNPEFGCKIWELDFERVVSMHKWEGQFVNYIFEAVGQFEQRIDLADVRVKFYDVRSEYEFSRAVSIRKRVDIQIDCTILSSQKKCCFYYSLYLGPLSSD